MLKLRISLGTRTPRSPRRERREEILVVGVGWSSSLASHLLLNQFVESAEVRSPAVLRIALCLHYVVLEGGYLRHELLIELSQLFLLLENVLAIENHLDNVVL